MKYVVHFEQRFCTTTIEKKTVLEVVDQCFLLFLYLADLCEIYLCYDLRYIYASFFLLPACVLTRIQYRTQMHSLLIVIYRFHDVHVTIKTREKIQPTG